ncbi:MAG TPA: NAD-dependent epimerase/dehydratase family protein, partial [Flavobacteriales bacterium]|nr:NAD-dependent epimerase/dehydratase family protein [Flavobacteriales bacterium]
MNILVIGGSGLVGSNCLKYFEKQEDVKVVGTYYSYKTDNTVFFDTLEFNNPKNFDLDSFHPDLIMHCGALTHVDYCEANEEESYAKTVLSTINVTKLCNSCKARMIYVSSDYVFDGENGPYDENA